MVERLRERVRLAGAVNKTPYLEALRGPGSRRWFRQAEMRRVGNLSLVQTRSGLRRVCHVYSTVRLDYLTRSPAEGGRSWTSRSRLVKSGVEPRS